MLSRRAELLISLLVGMVYPFGFAPYGWWPVSVISVAIIFGIWSRADKPALYWSALFYGLGVYGVGVSWVYVSMVNFGNMLPPMAAIAVLLFALILTTFSLALVFVYSMLSPMLRAPHRLLILLPALWVVFEALRGSVFTGFPWLWLGYTSTDTWFAAWSTLSGVLASGYVLASLAALIAYMMMIRNAVVWGKTIVLMASIVAVSWLLDQHNWTRLSGESIEVTLIQADVPLSEKWQPEKREQILQTYLAATKAASNSDLVVWPEGALPMRLDRISESYLTSLHSVNAAIALGVTTQGKAGDESQYYNSLAILDKGATQVYRKRHLVPFGEFFPFKPLLGGLFKTLNIPMSDYSKGAKEQANLRVKAFQIVPTICYEDAFPEDWRHKVSDAHAILNISEDAWFGDSFAPHQRLQMARMRAIEFQRPVIRVSNSGLSTVIDARGNIDATTPQFTPAIFSSPVYFVQGDTPYTQYGRRPLWFLLSLMLGLSVLSGRERR